MITAIATAARTGAKPLRGVRGFAGLGPLNALAAGIVAIVVVIAIAGLLSQSTGWQLTPYDPLAPDLKHRLSSPILAHPMGTDQLGRDVFWPWYARLARSRVVSLREQEFVMAARSLGASSFHLMYRTLLPLVWPLMVIQATLDAGFVMLATAGLSFLGLGAQPPTPEWGSMIFSALSFQPKSWWLAAFPGAALGLTALGFNLLGDGLRDHLDPTIGTHLDNP